MRIAFFGSDGFSVPSLEAAAAAGHEVALVVTNPDRPRGRSGTPQPTPVKALAVERGWPVFQPDGRPGEAGAARLREAGVELSVVVAYGQFLGREVRRAPSLGYAINVHASLLPRWRGAAPDAHAILAGDAITGVTVQKLLAKMDAGPVLAARETPIGPEETKGELRERLAHLGAGLLVDALRAIEGGAPAFLEQDPAGVTFAPLIQKTDGALELGAEAAALERRVRAMLPWPVAYLDLPSGRVQVLRARVHPEAAGAPGEVLALEEGPWIATGAGALELVEVKPAGKRAMPGSA
ncbi:MAG: methionyl-tRNA formyltransferase, partial [Planctomycetes bacterium]|nr:methionyl-tRNA formyltransferase [Planctomycetota bacterium]